MRARLFPLLLLTLAAPGLAQEATRARVGLRAMTFNVRYANDRDGVHAWHHRRELVAGVVRFHRPDVLGVQEALWGQVVDLHERLPGYVFFGEGRDGPAGGERCTIYYRPDRLELVSEETFWLSETPDRPSAAWGAQLRRIVTRGTFRERASGQVVHVFNTHFDHQSEDARRNSAALLRARIAAVPPGEPVVALGDFNCGEESAPYATLVGGASPLVDATYLSREPLYGPSGTWTGFAWGGGTGPTGRIDHVFVRGPLRVDRHAVIGDTRDGRVPSDHRPVLVDLTLGVPFEQPRLELRTLWRVRADPGDAGIESGWFREDHDERGWPVTVAGEAWEVLGIEEFAGYDGVGWYRRAVVLPEAWAGRGVHLVWPGIADAFTLWVNGEEVLSLGGEGESTYLRPVAVRLPATLLRFGAENQVTFRVVDSGGDGGILSAPPTFELDRAGSTDWSSAYAVATLVDDAPWSAEAASRVHTFETPTRDASEGWLVVRATVAGERREAVTLIARDADRVERGRVSAAAGELHLELPAAAGTAWTVEVHDPREPAGAGRLTVTWRGR